MTAPPTSHEDPFDTAVAERIAAYRRTREQVERSVLPLATSIDGVTFEFQSSLYHLALRRGGYVILQSEGVDRLGQVTDIGSEVSISDGQSGEPTVTAPIALRLARGSGIVLDTDGSPFHDALVRPAEPSEVGTWFERIRPDRAGLDVGELVLAPGVPAVLDSGGLDRHTFLCGQSGSGKTYALGLLLERVLAETSLQLVVLDPNSDYVGLSRVRDGADPALAARYAAVPEQVSVWSNRPGADHLLRFAFADLDHAAQAAVLGLDPIADREEYAVLVDLLRAQREGQDIGIGTLRTSEDPAIRRLGMRAENLGVLGWSIWSPTEPSLVEELHHPTSRCIVVDLGSLDTVGEQRTVSQAVLSTLWEERLSKVPRLIVIDEAHNICPADPPDEVSRLSMDQAIQIAAEGRKYGLYLLTSTQRPHKVHENIVSQCDNLLLMRMNSQGDLADLSALFSFIPQGLMTGSTSFRLGQVLVGGKLLRQPAYVQMGSRVSLEGGADIPTTWAAARPS